MAKSKMETLIEKEHYKENKKLIEKEREESKIKKSEERLRKKIFNETIKPFVKLENVKVDGLQLFFSCFGEDFCLFYESEYWKGDSEMYPAGDYWGWYLSKRYKKLDACKVCLKGETGQFGKGGIPPIIKAVMKGIEELKKH